MQTIVKASGPSDLLALVPVLAGYRPTQSIVFVLFEGSRSSGALRCDLPESGDDVDRTASTLIGLACKVPSVDGIAIVVYTDGTYLADDDVRHAALVHAVLARADACGVEVKAALCSASDAWGSYLDDRAAHPHAEVERRSAAAPLPLPAVPDSQAAGTELPDSDLAARERVGRAVRAVRTAETARHCAAPEPATDVDSRAFAAVCALDDPVELFEDALDWETADLEPYAAAALLWCLDRPLLRDVALSQWCRDHATGDETLAAQLDWHEGADIPERLAQHLWGDGPAPDFDRLERALALVRSLASLAPRAVKAGALATAAWISWALGQSTHASLYARDALAIDRDHGMAAIVMTLATSTHLPEWAFRRTTSGR